MNDNVNPGRYNNEQAFENNNETDDPLLYAPQDKGIDKMGLSHLEPESELSHCESEGGLSHLEPEGDLTGFDPEMHVTSSEVAEAMAYEESDHETEPRLNAFDDPVLQIEEEQKDSGMLIVVAVFALAIVAWFVWPAS